MDTNARRWLNRIMKFAWRPLALGPDIVDQQAAGADDAEWIYVRYVAGLRNAVRAERDERAASEQRRSA